MLHIQCWQLNCGRVPAHVNMNNTVLNASNGQLPHLRKATRALHTASTAQGSPAPLTHTRADGQDADPVSRLHCPHALHTTTSTSTMTGYPYGCKAFNPTEFNCHPPTSQTLGIRTTATCCYTCRYGYCHCNLLAQFRTLLGLNQHSRELPRTSGPSTASEAPTSPHHAAQADQYQLHMCVRNGYCTL